MKPPLKVIFGDGNICKAFGKGRVTLEVNGPTGRRECTLHGVLFVPGLAYNLFSVSKASETGQSTEFNHSGCSITEGTGRRLVARGRAW